MGGRRTAGGWRLSPSASLLRAPYGANKHCMGTDGGKDEIASQEDGKKWGRKKVESTHSQKTKEDEDGRTAHQESESNLTGRRGSRNRRTDEQNREGAR